MSNIQISNSGFLVRQGNGAFLYVVPQQVPQPVANPVAPSRPNILKRKQPFDPKLHFSVKKSKNEDAITNTIQKLLSQNQILSSNDPLHIDSNEKLYVFDQSELSDLPSATESNASDTNENVEEIVVKPSQIHILNEPCKPSEYDSSQNCMCRTCLTSVSVSQCTRLYDPQNEQESEVLRKKITYIVNYINLQASHDPVVCSKCVILIEIVYNFIRQLRSAEQKFMRAVRPNTAVNILTTEGDHQIEKRKDLLNGKSHELVVLQGPGGPICGQDEVIVIEDDSNEAASKGPETVSLDDKGDVTASAEKRLEDSVEEYLSKRNKVIEKVLKSFAKEPDLNKQLTKEKPKETTKVNEVIAKVKKKRKKSITGSDTVIKVDDEEKEASKVTEVTFTPKTQQPKQSNRQSIEETVQTPLFTDDTVVEVVIAAESEEIEPNQLCIDINEDEFPIVNDVAEVPLVIEPDQAPNEEDLEKSRQEFLAKKKRVLEKFFGPQPEQIPPSEPSGEKEKLPVVEENRNIQEGAGFGGRPKQSNISRFLEEFSETLSSDASNDTKTDGDQPTDTDSAQKPEIPTVPIKYRFSDTQIRLTKVKEPSKDRWVVQRTDQGTEAQTKSASYEYLFNPPKPKKKPPVTKSYDLFNEEHDRYFAQLEGDPGCFMVRKWARFARKPHRIGPGPYLCEICGFKMVYKSHFYKHMEKHKTNEFMCSYCGLIVRGRTRLNNHVRAKHKPPSFQCKVCGKMFHLSSALASHMSVMHTKSDVKVQCDMCGQLVKPRYLTYHKKKHSEGVKACDICGKRFLEHNLSRHRQKHFPSKSLMCPYCHSNYADAGTLKQHITQVHQGIKWECSLCGQLLCRKEGLQRHLLKTHAMKRKTRTGVTGDTGNKNKGPSEKHTTEEGIGVQEQNEEHQMQEEEYEMEERRQTQEEYDLQQEEKEVPWEHVSLEENEVQEEDRVRGEHSVQNESEIHDAQELEDSEVQEESVMQLENGFQEECEIHAENMSQQDCELPQLEYQVVQEQRELQGENEQLLDNDVQAEYDVQAEKDVLLESVMESGVEVEYEVQGKCEIQEEHESQKESDTQEERAQRSEFESQDESGTGGKCGVQKGCGMLPTQSAAKENVLVEMLQTDSIGYQDIELYRQTLNF